MQTKVKSGALELCGVLLLIHLLGDVTYLLYTWEPSLSQLQLHLWIAAISVPTLIVILLIERRVKKRLAPSFAKWIVIIWLPVIIYVAARPIPHFTHSEMIHPSMNS